MISVRRLTLTISMVAAMVHVSRCAAQYWDQASVLLATGHVLSGKVEQQGDFFRIQQNQGNEVRIPRKQISAIGKNLNELYLYKKKALPLTARGGDHGQLARWCLSVNMLAEAGEHYLILAESHSPEKYPSVKQLGWEIRDRMLQQAEFRMAMGLPPIARESTNRTIGTNATVSSAPQAPMTSLTSATAGANPNAASAVQAASAGSPLAAGQIHPQLQQRFTEQIQHILVNRCGQAACHGHATKTPFRLFEIGGRDAAMQTQANLSAVLRYINQDPSSRSALVDYLTRAHGSMHAPAMSVRDSTLVADVTAWARMVQNPVVTAEATVPNQSLNPLDPAAPQLRQVPQMFRSDTGSDGDPPSDYQPPSASDLDLLESLYQAELTKISQQSKAEQIEAEQSQSEQSQSELADRELAKRDPFDPAEFNRRTASKPGPID